MGLFYDPDPILVERAWRVINIAISLTIYGYVRPLESNLPSQITVSAPSRKPTTQRIKVK